MPSPFSTNPSTIARYFFHDCERFLRFSAGGKTDPAGPAPERRYDASAVMQAVLDSGADWEREVLAKLGPAVLVAPGEGRPDQRRWDAASTVDLLRAAKPGDWLYQGTFRCPASFYEAYGLDRELVTVRDNHPDLVQVLEHGRRRRLRVVDVKRGAALKPTHRVQVLLYALELEGIVRDAGIDADVDTTVGGVWLGGAEAVETFDLATIRGPVERFLRHDLPRVLRADPADVAWHVHFRCEWCEWFDHCRDDMRASRDLSRLTGLTAHAKRFLTRVAGVPDLGALAGFLAGPEANRVLARCASLAGKGPRLRTQVAALEGGAPLAHGASAMALPIGENVGLYLTLQQEPLGQRVWMAGALVSAREDVREELGVDGQPWLRVAERPEDADDVRRDLVVRLYALLEAVAGYNAHRDWKGQLSLQAYVYAERERALLSEILLASLHEPDLAERAMTLLLHFHAPELSNADDHPSGPVPYPLVAVVGAMGRLVALPVDVSYTLPEALEALGSEFRIERKDYFHFPLGHGLRADVVHAAWFGGKPERLDWARSQGRQWLYGLRAVLRRLRDVAGEHLVAWPPKFVMPAPAAIDHPLLSRLAFLTEYDSLLRCIELRDGRSETRDVQELTGGVVVLEALGDRRFRVLAPDDAEVDESDFPSFLLVPDDDAGRRAQLRFPDWAHRVHPYRLRQHADLAVVAVDSVVADDLGYARELTVDPAKDFDGRTIAPGDRFLLHPRYTDATTGRVVSYLTNLDGDPGAVFTRFLEDVRAAATPAPLPADVARRATKAGLGLTASQEAAWDAIVTTRFASVWGPPGTGKTHFLASLVDGLARAHAGAGRPFRVLVTAFTHAAIENLLRKIVERSAEVGVDVDVAKASGWRSSDGAPDGVDEVPQGTVGAWLDGHDVAVVGSTVYALAKEQEPPAFDLVLIDEASQLRVAESSIAISHVGAGGRVVFAGDDEQLGPIVAGEYPDPEPGQPVLHRSVFELSRGVEGADGRRAGVPVLQLLENFRMNDVLTGVSARLLYGPGYRCAHAGVAARRLAFVAPPGLSPLAEACLDPACPLVVVVLEGVQAPKANPVEAGLVAELVVALRGGLRARDGQPYDDEAFFDDGVFVVSPHHAQIAAIQRALAARRRWDRRPFVDTVDKMQGQEADAVVVSYGVSDPELALREAEFIYGRNRLNVAITRARSKSVVFLPRPLLEPPPEVLANDVAADGIGFMQGLVDLARAGGEPRTFELGDGARAVVYRLC